MSAKVTTEGHDASPRSMRQRLGPQVVRHCSRSNNAGLEQDHRGVTQRSYALRGVERVDAAARFRSAHDELRAYLRSRQHLNEPVFPTNQRRVVQDRWGEVTVVLQAR